MNHQRFPLQTVPQRQPTASALCAPRRGPKRPRLPAFNKRSGLIGAGLQAGPARFSSSASRWKRCSTWWITGANITPASTRNTTPANRA